MKRILIVAILFPALVSCGAGTHAELPEINVRCASGEVNGPAEVPYDHPVLEFQGTAQADLWLEVAVVSGGQEERHLLDYFGGQTSYSDEYQGWLGDMRGETGNHILTAGNGYILRGFRAPYGNYPDFSGARPLFEAEFSVPECGG